MARYDRVPPGEDDILDPQRQQQQQHQHQHQRPSTSSSSSFLRAHPGLFLPELTTAIRARASSLVSDISRSSFHRNANINTKNTNGYNPDTPTPLLSIRSHSYSSNSPPSPSSATHDTQSLQRSDNSSGSRKSQRIISNQSVHVRLLRLIWMVALFVGEHGSYWAMVRRCAWPENSSWGTSDEAIRERYRVAIVADPQLTDWMSYHQSGLLLALVETYTDIYMKRSFHRMHASLRPDAVLFLGDLNDGGRNSRGEVFEKNRNRFFERVFETKSTAWNQRPLVIDPFAATEERQPDDSREEGEESARGIGHYHQLVDVPLDSAEREAMRNAGRSVRLYVAGNHDVGFGDTLIRSSMVRFKQVFGAVNYEIEVGNHSLVVLDTLSLSSDIQDIREESQQFLKHIDKERPTLPRILFTHVPLFRLDTTYCGDARETEQLILNRKGEQYQNMVNITLSREILRSIQPDMVFSGDDHDWCEIAHSLDGTLTPEVTLPTFSFAQGILQPGFVMLSLYNPDHKAKNVLPMVSTTSGLPISTEENAGSVANPSENTTFVYEECMLPNQMLIYLCYGVLLGCSLSWILMQRLRWMVRGRRHLAERSILVRWRNSSSSPPSGMDSAPQGSTTATAIPSQLQAQAQQDRCYDDYVGGSSDGYLSRQDAVFFDSAGGKHSKIVWPLLSSIYWKMAGWDLWNIVRYVIPFYIFLFVASII